MKQKNLKRFASLLLSVMVFVVFTMASAMEVNASSSKNFYLVSKIKSVNTYTYTTEDGATKTDKDTTTSKYSYNKKGLQTKVSFENGYTKYLRDKSGQITGYKHYDKDGNIMSCTEMTRKSNGDISKTKNYYYLDGKKTLSGTISITYWSKGKIKKRVYKGTDLSYTDYYDKKGNLTKTSQNGGKTIIKYERTPYTSGKKKGLTKKMTATYSGEGNMKKVVTKYTFSFENDRISKETQKTTNYYKDGSSSKESYTVEYTYNKRGDIKKIVDESKRDGFSTKTVSTYTYTKVSVPKKYWKLYE